MFTVFPIFVHPGIFGFLFRDRSSSYRDFLYLRTVLDYYKRSSRGDSVRENIGEL